jgi:hypothetical protein
LQSEIKPAKRCESIWTNRGSQAPGIGSQVDRGFEGFTSGSPILLSPAARRPLIDYGARLENTERVNLGREP